MTNCRIFINAGHSPNGQPDPGAVNEELNLKESDITWYVANKVKVFLEDVGYQPRVVQSDSLELVVDASNHYNPELFVSLHCNAADNKAASGTETWYMTGSGDGLLAAGMIQNNIMKAIHLNDRGLKVSIPGVSGLYVLKHTDAPAVLVEMAFISNEYDARILGDKRKLDVISAAIARGISDYHAVKNKRYFEGEDIHNG